MKKPAGMTTPLRRAWQAWPGGALPFALAVQIFSALAARAEDAPLPALPLPGADAAVVQTLGDAPFRIPAEVAAVRISPDGTEIFAVHENEARISIVDAQTGRTKTRLPLHAQGFDLSADGHLLAGIHDRLENERLKRPFGVWKWPERTARWTRDDLGMPGAAKFSPDGKMLAVLGSIPGARSGTFVAVFDALSGRELWRVSAPESENHFASGLAWLENTRLMATIPERNRGGAQIFRASDGQRVELDSDILKETSGKEQIVVAEHAPVFALYNELHFEVVKRTRDEQLESILSGSVEDAYDPDLSVSGLDLSPDGRFLFVATPAACAIYDLEKRAVLRKLQAGATAAHFSADGETVVTALHSGIELLATKTWTPRLPSNPPAHRHAINQVLFSPDGNLLASNDGEQILLWDWRKAQARARIPYPTAGNHFKDMVFHPQDTLLVAGNGAEIFWWDFAAVPGGASGLPADAAEPAHKRMFHLNKPPRPIHETHLCFDGTGQKLVVATDRFASLIEFGADAREPGKRLRQLTLGSFENYEYIRDVALRPDGQRFSIATDLQLRSFDLETEEKTGEWKTSAYGRDGKVTAFSPDGRWFAMNEKIDGRDLAILDATTGTAEMTLPVTDVRGLLSRTSDWKVWSADGSRLACSAYNGFEGWAGCVVWDMKTGRRLGIQTSERGRILAIAFTPDGRHLAAANVDGSIQIWDLEKAFHK